MRKLLLALIAVTAALLVAQEAGIFTLQKSDALIGRQKGEYYLLPTGQLLKSWGEQLLIRGRPVDLCFDSTNRLLVILNMREILFVDPNTNRQLGAVPLKSTSYTGLTFRPGDRELWVSEVTRNGPDSIQIVEVSESGEPGNKAQINLEGHPVPSGIAFSSDGKRAYVAFSRNNSLAVIDTNTRKVLQEIEVGVAPFAVVVSAGMGNIFVSNRGGRQPRPGDPVAPSSGSSVVVDPQTGAASSGTVSVIAIETGTVREVPVGLGPSGMALSSDGKILAVVNGHSDSITLMDTETLSAREVKIAAWPEGALGSQPTDAVFAEDGKTLYVTCGGSNAVAVLKREGPTWGLAGALPSVEGSLPSGWFPSAIAIDRSGALRIINIKGVGNTADKEGTFNSKEYEGSLSTMSSPTHDRIEAGTRAVEAANRPRFTASGGVENLDSLAIQHVFLIIKENRTYDQVFGDIPEGNGDPKLVMYGKKITPNHHALAERYVLLDNFYASGAISFDGHHWLMQAFVSDYVERAFAASPRGYAWNMGDALTVSPSGFFWQGAPRPLDLRIYGEFSLPARWDAATRSVVDIDEEDLLPWGEYWRLYKEGKWRDVVRCKSAVPALEKYMDSRYPPSTMNIPDQLRAEVFLEELKERERSGKMPHLSIFTLPADHTRGTRPGSPTPRAMVADNDLALGRMVEGISKSRFWPRSLILVVEDDAQNGLDHVSGYRTVALAIGPHIRRHAVDSNNYSHISMIRTIQEIFQIPARTRFLENARAMNSIFTVEPDIAPYEALVPDVPLDEMNPPVTALRGRRLWAAQQSLAMNWDEIDDVPFDVLNRILWWDSNGYETPYPDPNAGK